MITVLHGRGHGTEVGGQRNERLGTKLPQRRRKVVGQLGVPGKAALAQLSEAHTSKLDIKATPTESGHEQVTGVLKHRPERTPTKHRDIATPGMNSTPQPRQRPRPTPSHDICTDIQ